MKPFRMTVVFVMLMTALYRSAAEDEIPAPPPLDLPLLAPEDVPDTGTFFSAAHSEWPDQWPPLPYNYLATTSNVPVYSLAEAFGLSPAAPFYLVDDRVWCLANLLAEQERQALTMTDRSGKRRLDEPEPIAALRSSGPPPGITTNDLWLEINDDNFTNGFAALTLHNTVASNSAGAYQLMLRTNLTGRVGAG